MQPQILDLISIPLIAGTIGYITNRLAIKMLFRPYKAKWYTLGWQGIVPRSRKKLASIIGETVAKKLLLPDDIAASLEKRGISANISSGLAGKLKSITAKDVENALAFIDIRKTILENKETIDSFARNAIKNVAKEYLNGKIPTEKIKNAITDNLNPGIAAEIISEQIRLYAQEAISSSKPLSSAIPPFFLSYKEKAAKALTEKAADLVKAAGRSAAVKEAAAEKIIEFKNSFFSGGGRMDLVKMGFVNMVLTDETISNTVKRELPTVMDSIADDKRVKDKIYENIIKEIDLSLNMPIKDAADKSGIDMAKEIYLIINSKKTEDIIRQSLSSIISKIEIKYSNVTILEAMNAWGLDPETYFDKISVSEKLISDTCNIKNLFYEKAARIISANSNAIAMAITERGVSFLKNNIPAISESMDIEKTVEGKIDSMPISEVENVLFSFMKDHFKWINRLGFILGFIIGSAQAAVIYFTR